jgi:hypothetical protein
MDIKNIIKELNNICEDVYELHNLIICNKLYKINKYIKPHICNELYKEYNKEIENIFLNHLLKKI